jgi:chromosome segregation ATPase
MSPNAAADQAALYSIYLNGDWAGPYRVSQIRELVAQGTIATDAIAYAASQERHYMVEELLATSPPAEPLKANPADSITQGMPALFDDVFDMAPQSSESFDNVLPDLKAFYVAYLGLTEHTGESKKLLADLLGAHQKLIQELDHRRSDINTLSRVINEIDHVGDYLANRHQLPQLWQLLSEMEKIDLAVRPDDGVSSARAVLALLAGRAEVQANADDHGSSVLLDLAGLDDEADSVITRKILLSARSEVASTKRDMDVLQQTYNELQEQHNKDLEDARKKVEKAESARREERLATNQTIAEVRNLAAEIQRLANKTDITGSDDHELVRQIVHLGEELRTADASTLAYMAEDVLIRMVAHLRNLATNAGGDSAPLRAELAHARESLAQAHAQVAQLTTERDNLRIQHEQSRLAAEKASERAKEREHRLRSTVTALEVTKELHQEVMEDLKVQLQTAQGRVEDMERNLASVRGEMKDTTGTVEARGKAIQHEMQRMVEMKTMLEVRSNELSTSLKNAEADLAKAQSSETGQDTSLAEALAAKVTQLRATYEITTNRLKDQESIAERLTRDLEVSRQEALELRGRSDQLSSELGEARGSLSAARHRLEELSQAYARLDAERESLHTELHHRKQTDTIHKLADGGDHPSERISKLERDSAMLERQLGAERRQAEQLAEARNALEVRITEIAGERNELRQKLDSLQQEHLAEHTRHTAAIAKSTQAAIEAERRLRELQNQIGELEARLTTPRKSSDGLEPSTVRVAANANHGALESTEQPNLRAKLDEITRQRDVALAEVEALRAVSAPPLPLDPTSNRLVELEQQLSKAHAEVAAIAERHAQVVAERDRVQREFARLRNELESAAVEHRTALKSARDRLSESQERVTNLERQLTTSAERDADGGTLRKLLDESVAEQERLAGELARLQVSVPADRDQQIIGLAKATQQLASEQEKVNVLTRSLVETLQQSASARDRAQDLQTHLDLRTGERDQLQLQLNRLRAELDNARLGVGAGTNLDEVVKTALSKRDQALAELEHVRQELTDTKAQFNLHAHTSSALENLGHEQQRIRTLENQLSSLQKEADQRQQMFNEARARMVQVSSECDRLAAELAELKSRPDQEAELKMLRRRLIRAKRQIKRLRRERDAAVAERQHSATNLHELTGQIERLKNAQRAAAEALGLPPSALPMDPQPAGTSKFSASDRPAVITREFHPVDLSGSRLSVGAAGAKVRPLAAAAGEGGLVSAFGRPRVISKTANYGNVPVFTSRLGAPSVGNQSHPALMTAKSVRKHMISRKLVVTGIVTGGLIACAGMWVVVLPNMFPISDNAVVNCKVSIIRTPIDGQIIDFKALPGASIAVGQVLAKIQNDRLDHSQLRALETEAQNNQRLLVELQQRHDTDHNEKMRLSDALSQWRATRVLALTTALDSAKAAQTLAKNAVDNSDARLRGLRLAGVPTADLVETAVAYERAKLQLAAADKAVSDLEKSSTAVAAGECDSEWERYSILDETTKRLAISQSEIPRLSKVTQETNERKATEEARLARLRTATVTATKDGKIQKLFAREGKLLHSGESIASIALPVESTTEAINNVVIECAITDSLAKDINVRDEITAYLMSNQRKVRGRVIEKVEPSSAIESGTADKSDWSDDFISEPRNRTHTIVRIAIEGETPAWLNNDIKIPQGVKVMFLGSNPSMLDRFLATIARIGRF